MGCPAPLPLLCKNGAKGLDWLANILIHQRQRSTRGHGQHLDFGSLLQIVKVILRAKDAFKPKLSTTLNAPYCIVIASPGPGIAQRVCGAYVWSPSKDLFGLDENCLHVDNEVPYGYVSIKSRACCPEDLSHALVNDWHNKRQTTMIQSHLYTYSKHDVVRGLTTTGHKHCWACLEASGYLWVAESWPNSAGCSQTCQPGVESLCQRRGTNEHTMVLLKPHSLPQSADTEAPGSPCKVGSYWLVDSRVASWCLKIHLSMKHGTACHKTAYLTWLMGYAWLCNIFNLDHLGRIYLTHRGIRILECSTYILNMVSGCVWRILHHNLGLNIPQSSWNCGFDLAKNLLKPCG